jgi:hypothetical protein
MKEIAKFKLIAYGNIKLLHYWDGADEQNSVG